MQRHSIGRPLQRASSGSTPHDRVTIPQICSSPSLAFDRPRQSALRHPAVASNRPANHSDRREPPLIQRPFHRRQTCWSASTPFTHLIRGTQIPIAHAAPPTCPSRGFLPWRFADAGPGVRRATIMGPASENLHKRRHRDCRASSSSRYGRGNGVAPRVRKNKYYDGNNSKPRPVLGRC